MPYDLRPRKQAVAAEPAPPKTPKAVKVAKKAATPKPAASKTAASKPATIKKEAARVSKKPPKNATKKEESEEENAQISEEDDPKPASNKRAIKSDEDETKPAKKPKLTSDAKPRLYMFGSDSCGELGLGKIGVTKKSAADVPIDEEINQVACGPMHTLALTVDGALYSFGCNDEGALGRVTDGDEDLEATPTKVELTNKGTKVTAGDSHSAILTDQHEVFVWGNFRDEHGSVGLTPECNGQSTVKPLRLLPDIKFKDIASGSNHMLLLDVDGNVYSFGVGAQGQLGRMNLDEIGDTEKPISINDSNRDSFLTPQKVSLKNVDPQRPFICDAVYAGNFSSFATNTDKKKNRLAGWGLNNYFQLGYKGQKGQLVQPFPRRSTFTCSTSMINVACGQHHTLFLTKTGRVYSAGRKDYGMLGLGKVDKEICPAQHVSSIPNPVTDISAGINTSFAVDCEGILYAWGMGGYNLGQGSEDQDLTKPTPVPSLKDKKVESVSSGGAFTSVVATTS